MTETLLIALAVSQVIVMFFICVPYYGKVLINLGLRKNPKWVKEHSEFNRQKVLDVVHTYFHYALGVVTSVMIIKYVWITPGAVHSLWLLLIPMVISVGATLMFMIVLQRLVISKIPAPELVKASLDDRRLSTLIPMWVIYGGLALIGLIYVVYGWAYTTEIISTKTTSERLIGLSGFMVLWGGMLIYTLKRKHSEIEIIFKENGRKIEMWNIFAVLYLGVFVGLWRVLGDFYSINLFSDSSFFIVVGVFVQLSMLAGYLKLKGKPELLEREEKYG